MWRIPDGYGSISSWYQCGSSAAPGSGFTTLKARSSSQTRCHLASIVFASYRSKSSSRDRKASRQRGRGESARQVAACVSLG